MASNVPHLLGAACGRLGPKSVAIELTFNYAAALVEENDLARKRIRAELHESAVRCRLIANSSLVEDRGAYCAALERENARSRKRVEQELALIAERRRKIEDARCLARALESAGYVRSTTAVAA